MPVLSVVGAGETFIVPRSKRRLTAKVQAPELTWADIERMRREEKRARALVKPAAGEPLTPAKASRYRRAAMIACGCVRCGWALSPARTFAEHDARIAEVTRRNEAGDWQACDQG